MTLKRKDPSEDLTDYIESVFKELPKEMQTETVKEKLILQANDIIMSEIAEYMSPDDLKDTLELNQDMKIPIENVLQTYIDENPELLDRITDELNRFAEMVIKFASKE